MTIKIKIVERVLRRHVSEPCPEAHLHVAVLCQAIADTRARDIEIRSRAHRFLKSDEFVHIAELVGLEPEFVRTLAHEAGYLKRAASSPTPAYQRVHPRGTS